MAQAQGLPGYPLIQSAKQPGQFREPGLVRQDGLTAAGVTLAGLCQILGQVTYLSRGGGIGRGDGVEGLDATAAHPAERAILDVVSPSQPLAGVDRPRLAGEGLQRLLEQLLVRRVALLVRRRPGLPANPAATHPDRRRA